MDSDNLGRVFAPTLFRAPPSSKETDPLVAFHEVNLQKVVIKYLISQSLNENAVLSFSSFQLNDRMMNRLQRDQEEEQEEEEEDEGQGQEGEGQGQEREGQGQEEAEGQGQMIDEKDHLEDSEAKRACCDELTISPVEVTSLEPEASNLLYKDLDQDMCQTTLTKQGEEQEGEEEEEEEEDPARGCIVSYDLRVDPHCLSHMGVPMVDALSSDEMLIAAWEQVQQHAKRGISLEEDGDGDKREG
jgi:hypothetical protein